MRQLASLTNDEHARRLTAYLITKGIVSHVEEDADRWLIWIREEDSLAPALELYQEFLLEPDHSRYREAVQEATTLLREDAKRQREEQSKRNYVEMRGRWRQGRAERQNPLTKMLIALSIIVTLLSGGLYSKRERVDNGWLRHLMFADSELVKKELVRIGSETGGVTFNDQREVATISLRTNPLELWRLVTPIFLHFGLFHILFNMLWLHDLGSSIENRYGTPRYCGLIITIAILSVLAQSLAPTTWGPFSGTWRHGGMSGVVYGLFGFVWIRTRLDPASRLSIRPDTVMLMVGWLFFCVFMTQTGMVPVANLAHVAGLLVGMFVARITLPRPG